MKDEDRAREKLLSKDSTDAFYYTDTTSILKQFVVNE